MGTADRHGPQPVPPSRYHFELDQLEAGQEHVGRGADLEPSTLLAAYRAGVFPMGADPDSPEVIDWWSPDPRGVFLPGSLLVSRSLRRSTRRFTVSVDRAFDDVVTACADPGRPGAWITGSIRTAYTRLHRLGWAHSVECWQGSELVGGLYGVAIGGLFAGESMFHLVRDASKVAIVGLHQVLDVAPDSRRLIDVQWSTDHLASLGVVDLSRDEYRQRVAAALRVPGDPWSEVSGQVLWAARTAQRADADPAR